MEKVGTFVKMRVFHAEGIKIVYHDALALHQLHGGGIVLLDPFVFVRGELYALAYNLPAASADSIGVVAAKTGTAPFLRISFRILLRK